MFKLGIIIGTLLRLNEIRDIINIGLIQYGKCITKINLTLIHKSLNGTSTLLEYKLLIMC
jgi:hypothetical protein